MPEYTDDLADFLDPDLTLKIRGEKYKIVSPSAREGLRLRRLFSTEGARFTDAEEITEVMTLLGATEDDLGEWTGGTWSAMVDAGLTWPEIFHAGRTALMHFGLSAKLARVQWHTGAGDLGNPPPSAPAAKATEGKRPKKKTSRVPAPTARTTPAADR